MSSHARQVQHLAQSAGTRERVVTAAREVLEEMRSIYVDAGGCDHSVGICWCEYVRRALALKESVQLLAPGAKFSWPPT